MQTAISATRDNHQAKYRFYQLSEICLLKTVEIFLEQYKVSTDNSATTNNIKQITNNAK